jgi:NADH-quinone oxidoreductase subunit L
MIASVLSWTWAVVLLPFVLAVVIATLGRYSRVLGPFVASIGPLSLLVVAIASLVRVAGSVAQNPPWTSALATSNSASWLLSSDYSLRVGYAVDSLAALMLVVVGLVALCVMVFSAGYMAGDPGWNRYFALLSLFTGSMAVLVVGDSFLTMFIGWELVGASSYLLIGFWYSKPSAASAAVKAFLTTRVGDVAMMLGLAVLWTGLGTLQFEEIALGVGGLSTAAVVAAVLIALGAMGKSAQFPFHGWLPDAMEGPTPVSALIHAATMVAAGVYLVVRIRPLFEAAPVAQLVLLGAGIVSAFGAALIAVAQTDIKKVLAYSTISQLGFMFAALGVGAWDAAFFHLVTHAGFKGLLFLTAGSVIHGCGTQDLREMGGLRSSMPVTFAVWMAGALALVGIPGFSGFFSKDAVLERVWHASPALGIVLLAAGGLTALYMTRATRLAFLGKSRSESHAHESPPVMLVPLMVLAVPAVAAGFAGGAMLEWLGAEHEPLALGIAAATLAFAVVGIALGWRMSGEAADDERVSAVAGGPWRAMQGGFGWDRAVDRLVVRPFVTGSRAVWAVADRLVADGIVEGLAVLARWGGGALSRMHGGNAQGYSAVMAFGVLAMLILSVWLGR